MKNHFDFLRFCNEQRIPFVAEGHKHCRPGWIQLEHDCFFCTGNEGHHLGFNMQDGYFNCWRCGFHKTNDVVAALLNSTPSSKEVRDMVRQYQIDPSLQIKAGTKRKKVKHAAECVLPYGCGPLQKRHLSYLRSRRYVDPKLLGQLWGLQATGPLGPYKFRIIAPIFHGGRLVSYQGRDVTNKADLKYKACKKVDEVRDHKRCLYGDWLIEDKETIVVVEGIADAWRLGPGAVATFGIEYKMAQVLLLKEYRNRHIFFDSADPQAMAQAFKLADELSAFSGKTFVLKCKWKDPGEMPQVEANKLMRRIFKRSTTYR